MPILSDEQKEQLEKKGYLIFRNLLSSVQLAQVLDRIEQLWQEEGKRAGKENYLEPGVRRLANLANKGEIFRYVFAHPSILASAETVVGPNVRLSMLNAREVPAQFVDAQQQFHCDTDNSGTPDERGYFSCTAIWMLDEFTLTNGATRLVPGTHLSHQVPATVLNDTYATHPDEITLTGQPGDAAFFNGHCWHAGGINQTDKPRRALLAHYLRSDIPRPADRRQHLSPETKAQMSQRELEILGLDEKQYGLRLKYAASNIIQSLKTKLPIE